MGKSKKVGKKEKNGEGETAFNPGIEDSQSSGQANINTAEEWGSNFEEPQVEWVAPPNQLKLTPEELNSTVEPIILKNGNPNVPQNTQKYDYSKCQFIEEPPEQYQELQVHFENDGIMLHKESVLAGEQERWINDEFEKKKEVARKNEGEDGDFNDEAFEVKEVAKNQFNYSSRAAQTFTNPLRSRGVSTKPPELRQYNDCVSQWSIYDFYIQKFLEDIKDKKTMVASQKKKKSNSNNVDMIVMNIDEDNQENRNSKKQSKEEDIIHSTDMAAALKILERIVNQNAELEVYEDFKYWEDQSDAFREGEGSLLPLWRFSNEKTKRKHVTAICWNPSLPDLFAVGYGSYDFMRQGLGMVCCYSLKNTAFPEYSFSVESGVMCLDFHPQDARSALLAVGCYDGSVMVFDVRNKVNKPIYVSTIRTGKHTDPVWGIRWQEDDIAKELGFFSVSTDGQVASWIMSKNELKMEPFMQSKLTTAAEQDPEEDAALTGFAGGCCFDFNKRSEHLFLVGTEEGKIHKCSKAYSGQYLETYEGHHMAVYAVKWNPYSSKMFLSCSADWTVKLWDHNFPRPLMSFDLGNAVGDIAWAPYSSTVFSAVSNDGKVHVFDLSENKHEPLCEQKVVKRSKLTHVAFNSEAPILLVGDDRGGVNSLKLSPNLRKPVLDTEQVTRIEKLISVTDYQQV